MTPMLPTHEQINAALEITIAVADCIKGLGEVPSGHLYAQLMGKLTLEQYESIIRTLTSAGLIKVEAHLITWLG